MEQISQETLQKIKLPKNVRQIGTIDRNSRIYIEDYVVTYLNQMAATEHLIFGLAALYGRTVFSGKEKYVFISGAVFREEETEEETFSLLANGPSRDLLFDFEMKKERYFSELDPVGIAILHGEGTTIPPLWNHKTKLLGMLGRGAVQIRLCANDQTKEYAFYNDEGLEYKEGHYVYFDQNEAMQSYLVEWHASEQTVMEAEQEDFPTRTCKMMLHEKRENREQEKSTQTVSWASVFLLVAICAVGIVMIRRYDKTKDTEAALDELSNVPVTELVVSVDTITIPEQQSLSENTSDQTASSSLKETEDTSDNAVITNSTSTEAQEVAEVSDNIASQNAATSVSQQTLNDQQENVAILVREETVISPQEYTIEKGDTLCSISRRYYGSENQVQAICEVNHILDQDNIFYGQVIILP